MAKNKAMSKSDIKKLNKVYKQARERVHHSDLKRLDPHCFCLETEPEYTDVCEALELRDRGRIAEVFLSLNQKKRELLFAGEINETEYINWCNGIRMTG